MDSKYIEKYHEHYEKLRKIANIDGFFVRIRGDIFNNEKDEKNEKELDKSGKVYYMGISPFQISTEGLLTKSNLYEALFKFNSTAIEKINNNREKKNLLYETLQRRNYFFKKFKLNGLALKKGTAGIKNSSEFHNKLKELKEMLNTSYKIDKDKYLFSFPPVSLEKEYEIYRFIYHECKVKGKKGMRNSNYFKSCKFKYIKELNSKNNINTMDNLSKNFIDKTMECVKDYERNVHVEPEKKYQHLFLKYIEKEHVFKYGNEKIMMLPFEEEYYTKDKNDSGRIDCICYSVNAMNDIDKIFLIELKVGIDVIGKSNGIHKHLLDIKEEIDNDFFDLLLKRINFRNKVLYDHTPLKYSTNYEKNFYIIISGLKAKDSNQNDINSSIIEDSINDLNNPNSKLYKEVIQSIDKKYKKDIKPIKDMYNLSNISNVEIFIDKEVLDRESYKIEPDFYKYDNWKC